MKKTLKFALLTAIAVLSSTSAWATPLTGTTHYYGSGLQYKITAMNTTTNTYTVEASHFL